MKKILFSLSTMVVLLQFSYAAEASQGKYIIQDRPVSFTEVQETQSVDLKQPVKEEQQETNNEIKEIKQEVAAPKVEDEQPQQQEEKVEQNENTEINQQPAETVQKQETNKELSKTEKIMTIFNQCIDNSVLIVNNADMISVNGLLLMQKAVYQNSPEIADYEKQFNEINSMQNEDEKIQALYNLKEEIATSIENQLKVTDFKELSKDEKYMWGKGSFYLKIAQNRYENVSNNLSPFYKGFMDGELDQKAFSEQLTKAENLTKRMADDSVLQKKLIAVADKLNAENQISIQIPEKEQIAINPNGAIYSMDKQINALNAYIFDCYKETIQNFELGQYLEQAKDENFEQLPNNQKVEAFKDLMQKGIIEGFGKLLEEKQNNPDLTLSQEKVNSLIKISNTVAVANKEYPKTVRDSKALIKKVNKNKVLKKCMIFDIEKLNEDIKSAEKNLNDIKSLQSTITKVITSFKAENPIK